MFFEKIEALNSRSIEALENHPIGGKNIDSFVAKSIKFYHLWMKTFCFKFTYLLKRIWSTKGKDNRDTVPP